MVDELAQKCEESGELLVAAELDTISMLVVTADKEISVGVSSLADDLQRHFPKMDTELALHTAKVLYAKNECREEEEEDVDAEEKEGIFPMSALPLKERRQGPRPEDVPIGTVEWWK
jgi:hypothetical protein